MSRIDVVHVITGLGGGGAEAMLVKLVTRLDAERFSSRVVSLLPGGVNEERLLAQGIPTSSLRMSRRAPDPRAPLRLARLLAGARPTLVQTWMPHADLIGGLAARLAGIGPLAWNLQHSTLPPAPGASLRVAFGACRRLAGTMPTRIVTCSEAGAAWHAARGYPLEKMVLIENGIDVARFRPDAHARHQIRDSLGVADDEVLVGVPARYAPEKDHGTFFDAVAPLVASGARLKVVLCGDGTGPDNVALSRALAARQLEGAALRLGRRDDMERLLPALDVACLSSSHVEAFSNALGEAMAAGVACVSTDVGDSRRLLGEAGLTAMAGDAKGLGEAIATLLREGGAGRARRGEALRHRVATCFSIDESVRRYAALYEELAGTARCA